VDSGDALDGERVGSSGAQTTALGEQAGVQSGWAEVDPPSPPSYGLVARHELPGPVAAGCAASGGRP
jgi:hypothetical protein